MLLLEIAAQGVKGVSPAGGSARLRPGYNLVPFEGAALRRLMEALFHPAPGDAEALRGGAPGGGPMRVGVTLLGDDGGTWRLVRDYAAGSAQLQRLDPQRRAFALVAQEPQALAGALAERVGAPGPGASSLLTLSAAELPSRRRVAHPTLAGAAAARRPLAPGEADRRLAELRAELGRARRAEKIQYQLDGLQSRLFKLEEALRAGAHLREAVAGAEAALEANGPAAVVAAQLGDVEAKLDAQARALARRDEGLAKVAAERAALEEAQAQGAPRPPWADLRFWAGAGAGAAVLVAGLLNAPGHALRYLALLDIPSFGWAAWVALGWVEALEGLGRVGRRRKLVDEHEQKVLEAFERESAEVRGAIAALGVASVAELRDALQRLAEARAAVEEARARLAEHEAHSETRAATEERAGVEAELRDAEHALAAEAGGYVRDPRSVELELSRLEAELAATPEPRPTPPPVEATPSVAAAIASGGREPLQELLEGAAAFLEESPAAVARAAQPRAALALQALSAGRISGLTVDDRGHLSASVGARAVAASGLPPLDRDLLFLAVKLALMDRAGARRVAVVEDAFAQLPEPVRRIAGRLLKQSSQQGQLLHATRDPAYRESADHVVQALQ